jgi:hypothetical protein
MRAPAPSQRTLVPGRCPEEHVGLMETDDEQTDNYAQRQKVG